MPDATLSNIVTLYTDNILNVGVNTNQLNLIGYADITEFKNNPFQLDYLGSE
jgi:hypothetical protein